MIVTKKKIQAGLYEINGIQVRQLQSSISVGASRYRPWIVVWEPGKRSQRFLTLADALQAITDTTTNQKA